MDALHKQKLLINLKSLHKMASAWAMGAGGVAGTVWLSLPQDQQAAVVAHAPLPVWLAPIALTLAGLAARAWPQHGITKSEAVAKAADVPQPSIDKDAPQ